jgi:hypothetical protein
MRVDLALARSRYPRGQAWTTRRVRAGLSHSWATLEDYTWLHDVTRTTRYAHVVHATRGTLGCPDRRQLAAFVDDARRTDATHWCGRSTYLDEHYGIASEQFVAEAPIG